MSRDWIESETVRYCTQCGAEMDNRLRAVYVGHAGAQVPLCWLCLDKQLSEFDTVEETPSPLVDALSAIGQRFGVTFADQLADGAEPYLKIVPRESLPTERIR